MADEDEGSSIDIESGVSLFTGEPFCVVKVNGKSFGQLTPDETRNMAMHWLSAAEAAEQDAVVLKLLKQAGLDENSCGAFIMNMRNARGNDGG